MRSRREDVMRRGNQSSWYSDSFGRRHSDHPRGHERARSPRMRSRSPGDRGRRIRGDIRERPHSLERRDFRRYAGENINRIHRGQSPFDSRRMVQPGSAEIEGRRQLDEGFSRRDSPSSEFRRNFLVPERRGLNMEVTNDMKLGGLTSDPSVKNKEKDFHSGNNISVDHRMLVRKSTFLDDGSSHSFLGLPSQRFPIEDKPTGHPVRSDIRHGDSGSVQVHLRKNPQQEPYEVEGQEKNPKLFSRDMPYLSSAQTSTPIGISSSDLSKDSYFPSSYPTSLCLLPGVRVRGEKSSDVISDRPGPSNLFDTTLDPDMRFKNLKLYQTPVSPVRSRPYAYTAFGRRERDLSGFSDDDLCKKIEIDDRGYYPLRETLRTTHFMEPVGDKLNNDTAQRSFVGRASWDQPLHGEPKEILLDTHLQRWKSKTHEEFFSSTKAHQGFPIPKGMDRPFMNLADDHEYGREEDPLSYRDARVRSIHEREMDIYTLDRSPQHMPHTRDLDGNLPDGRLRDKYDVVLHRPKILISTRNDRNISKRFVQMSDVDEHWEDAGNAGRPFTRISEHKGAESWYSVEDGTKKVKGGFLQSRLSSGRRIMLGKRTRISDLEFSHPPHKHENRGHWHASRSHKVMEDKSAAVDKKSDKQMELSPNIKSDPPEDSGEFMQLVHKAFLRFSKQLNENPGQQRRYREQGKAGNMLCLACGSLSKEFTDGHSLVTHAYTSTKIGLRTDHLGLHKAVCVLLGWNSVVAPDNGKAYQSMPAAEASALKEDLLLWPPVVIVHDTIRNKNAETTDAMTNDNVEETLREMGFSGAKVCKGRPANQGVFVVKFLPTFSGLREAERLHNHLAENKRGKLELQVLRSKNGANGGGNFATKGNSSDGSDAILYGYLGIAEDLDKLDFESKKRCVVKSKKDIESIADARLDSE